MTSAIQNFFARSSLLDQFVLRPLAHIRPNWKLNWDSASKTYFTEDDSFAELLNFLVHEIIKTARLPSYHANEDVLANHVKECLNWDIKKRGNTWLNAEGNRLEPDDYLVTLQQGAFCEVDQTRLTTAVAGRIHAAIARGQIHFDEMEQSHQYILAGALSAILYHRADE